MGIIVWIFRLCCAIAVGLQVVVANDDLPIVIRSQRTVVGETNKDLNTISDSPETCSTRGIACGSCTSIMICNHLLQEVGSYECSSVDAQKPLCKDGICTDERAQKCNVASELCPGTKNKFYPVPSNCSESVFCDSNNYAQKQSAPSSSYVFNSMKQTWSAKKTAADCFQLNCQTSAMQNKFYAYKPNPRLYFYCASSGPLTLECGENEEFNETKRKCEFACKEEGNFGISDGKGGNLPDRYYSCLLNPNGTFQQFVLSCPSGLTFTGKVCELNTPPAPNS